MKMKNISVSMVVLASLLSATANGFQSGEYDEEALRLLRTMSGAIPLRTTSLQKTAPDFAVQKHPGLAWGEAVAEANSRFGQRQPERAVFLRKYLGKGSPEIQLVELQLPSSGISFVTGSGISRGFVFGPADKPTATITVRVVPGQLLIGEPTLDLTTATVEGVVYSHLKFDLNDHLTSATRQLPPNSKGVTLTVGQNTSGTGGVNFFWVQISAPGGESESINCTPDLVIRERWVRSPGHLDFREVYENGILRRRVHYNKRQVKGGTQTYIEREERFP